MERTGRIELASAGDFRLGCLHIQPPLRQATDPDGCRETIEPRVLQVLIALADAGGRVVSRDALVASCWAGRIVGDDAINRVIGQVRRLAAGIGRGSFRIETVPRVGYRLLADGPAGCPAPTTDMSGQDDDMALAGPDRRTLLTGLGIGAAAVVVGAGGVALIVRSRGDGAPPADIAPLLDQASHAMQQGTAEGADQAIGLLRRAVTMQPDFADGWGRLALTYAVTAQGRQGATRADLHARAQEAIARAQRLSPGNVHAAVATAQLIPQFGNWARIEATLRPAYAAAPANHAVLASLGALMGSVGRCGEAATLFDRAAAAGPPTPSFAQLHVQALWSAGRTADAERAMADALALYPSHFGVWFTRLHMLLQSGRAREALSQIGNREGRPTIVAETDFDLLAQVARAAISGAAADIDRAMATIAAAAPRGSGYAEGGMQYAALLGRADKAFRLADAYFFDQGFSVAERRFADRQRVYTTREERRTRFLFFPTLAALRGDERFTRLTAAVGLAGYWRNTGSRPDFLGARPLPA